MHLKMHMDSIDPKRELNQKEIKEAVKEEREVLKKYNAVSAVTDGPVEDMEGVPLPGDLFQGFPPTAPK